MAEKESTVYIVDVGTSMSSTHNGRDVSDLEFAMTYVWDKITSTVATGRTTATLGVIGLRTDGSVIRFFALCMSLMLLKVLKMNFRARKALNTSLYSRRSASVLLSPHLVRYIFPKPFSILLPDLKQLQSKIVLSSTDKGDGEGCNCPLMNRHILISS